MTRIFVIRLPGGAGLAACSRRGISSPYDDCAAHPDTALLLDPTLQHDQDTTVSLLHGQ
jgi:hypothetical protein